ncbi:MAG: HAD family hydrolase [Treponema sp.]|jgi:putative hydrolase of the HAD superfamily|nr:HAD family hydrolase [Treponema sp.]
MRYEQAERRKLVELIRRFSFPLEPLPPPPLSPPPDQESFPDAGPPRAVLFDVYGTLFCSAAGDIGTEGEPGTGGPGRREDLLEELAEEYAPGLSGTDLRGFFEQGVRVFHRELAEKTVFPELRVEELWARFLEGREAGGDPARRSRELALRYELAVNPVWPMPGAEETLRALARSPGILGIISNAQFYTPLLFEAFFGSPPEALGFDPALLIYSFEAGEAKPAPGLFRRAAERLAERGAAPAQCLYVGNDMFKDIYGAASAGFKTALFAGDGRSLRLREGEERLRGLRPNRIIRRLAELAELSPPVN